MAKICKYCGMESERDQVCTWCGKSLAEGPPGGKPAPVAAPPVAPGGEAPTGPSGPGRPPAGSRPGGGKHAGAARAMMEAEAARQNQPIGKKLGLGLGIPVGVLLVLQLGAYFMAMKAPSADGTWKQQPSLNKVFTVNAPEAWKFSTYGSPGTVEDITIKPGKVYQINVHGTQLSGIVGDIAGAAARAGASFSEVTEGELPLEKRREGSLHMFIGDRAKQSDPHFEDQGNMQAAQFAGMPAAWSYFTTTKYVGVIPVKIKGLRMTVPTNELGFDVRAWCPEKNWDKFEPTVRKILGSAVRG